MHSYESLFTHTHTHSSLGLYAHSYADVWLCVCVLVPSLCTLQCKTIKKHFVYCGIEALIRFALVHFASVWFVLFLSVSVWVSGYGFILAMPVILQPGQSRIVYYSTGTTQLPPLFVIELIPALRSPHSVLRTANCKLHAMSIISCHTVEIWLRFFHIQPRVYLIEIKSIFDCTTNNRDILAAYSQWSQSCLSKR